MDIIALLNQGLSTRKIATQLGLGHSTVVRVKKEALPNHPSPLKGRPPSMTPRQHSQIIRSLCSGVIDTATDAQQQLKEHHQVDISAQTIRNMLKRSNLKSFVKAKKPLLAVRHRRQRLEFARKYQHWTSEDWRRVVFSDETKINRFGSDGRKWCWKKSSTKILQPNHVFSTVKYGGGSLMVWGCMTAKGVGYLVKIEGTMNSELYCKILEEDLLNSLEWYDLDRQGIIFQHDNDPKHTAERTQRWLKDNEMDVLDWPPQSPDLNPIEHLWDHFKRRLSGYPSVASSMSELWTRAEEEWNKTTAQKCIELIDSMPQRIVEVIKAKGGHTRY
jgi:transposase